MEGMDFNDIFDTLSLNNLLKCQKLLSAKIIAAKTEHRAQVKQKKVEDFVVVFEDFVPPVRDNVLFAGLSAEVESLGLKAASGSTSTKWLSADEEAYTWSSRSGKETVNQPISIDSFPVIMELLQKVNKEAKTDLNSCLVTFFPDGKSGIRLHADSEDEMDPDSPICVFTIGAGRRVEFLSTYQTASQTPLLTITPKEGSLYIMRPGCQSFFRHRVPTVKDSVCCRYSLSFRKKIPKNGSIIIPPVPQPKPELSGSPVKSLIDHFDGTTSSSTAPKPASVKSTKRKCTTVLFGTSMTLHIDSDNIAGRGRRFINVSKNGASMKDISEMMDNFHGTSPAADDVEKVILSFGTNDIKHESHGFYRRGYTPQHKLLSTANSGIMKFREPIVDIVKKAKSYFPGACIVVQSVLPMRNLYWYTVENVMGFNDILRDVCRAYNCYYLDCFARFLSEDMSDYNRGLYNGWLHLNKWGRNILCKWLGLVTNTNSNMFNVVIDSLH